MICFHLSEFGRIDTMLLGVFTHTPGQIIYIAASALSGRLNVDWSGMIGRAASEIGAIEPAAAMIPVVNLDLGRMLLNVCISVVLESATMRPTEDCFSSEETGFNSILHNWSHIDRLFRRIIGCQINCCSSCSWSTSAIHFGLAKCGGCGCLHSSSSAIHSILLVEWRGHCCSLFADMVEHQHTSRCEHTPGNLRSAGGIRRTLLRVYAT